MTHLDACAGDAAGPAGTSAAPEFRQLNLAAKSTARAVHRLVTAARRALVESDGPIGVMAELSSAIREVSALEMRRHELVFRPCADGGYHVGLGGQAPILLVGARDQRGLRALHQVLAAGGSPVPAAALGVRSTAAAWQTVVRAAHRVARAEPEVGAMLREGLRLDRAGPRWASPVALQLGRAGI